MQINIKFDRSGREMEVGGWLWRILKWSWIVVLLWAATTAASIYILAMVDPLSFVDLEVHLDKDLLVKIDSMIPVKARIDQVLSLPVKDNVSADVLVDQVFEVPIDEEVEVPLDLSVPVSIDQDIRVVGEVPLKVEIPVNETLIVKLPVVGETPVVVKGVIPVDMTVPVDQKFRVKDQMPVRINQTVTMRVKKTMRVPIKQAVSGKINLDTDFKVPIATEIQADVYVQDMVKGEIDQALVLDKDKIRLRSDPEKTEEVKKKVFSQLPEGIKETLESKPDDIE